MTIQIVETTCTSYICAAVEESPVKVKLSSALRIDSDDVAAGNTNALARLYVEAKLEGRLRTISISAQNFESVHDNEELSTIIEALVQLIPVAEKRLKARGVLAEVDSLLRR